MSREQPRRGGKRNPPQQRKALVGCMWVLVIISGMAMLAGFGVLGMIVGWLNSSSSSEPAEFAIPEQAASGSAGAYALRGADASWPLLDDGAQPPLPLDQVQRSNYYLVLDASGSMLDRRCSGNVTQIEAAVEALKRFVSDAPANANLGLAAFDRRGAHERVPLAADNRTDIRRQLDQIAAGGGTPLLTAITIGYRQLTLQAERQLGYGEYHLVVVTDGQPDPSNEDPSPLVNKLLAGTPITVHTIGFCLGSNHVLNQAGRTAYTAADSSAALSAGLEAVLAEAESFDLTGFAN